MAAIVSTLIFVVTLILIFSEKVQRTIVATVGAALMVAVWRGAGVSSAGIDRAPA